MASATGMPATVPSDERTPLIGRPGPVKQQDSQPLPLNFVSGWGFVAVLSALGLTIFVITNALKVEPFILFLYHPIFQSLCFFFATMSILVLQPTHTAEQKAKGQKAHAFLMMLSMLSLLTGVIIIEYNKIKSNGVHFHSPHGVLGIFASAWFIFQYIGGFTMLNVPKVYGGEAKAKAVWKYHRRGGYVLYFAMLAAVIGSGGTDFVKAKMFDVVPPLVFGIFVAIGVYSRVRKEKLGF
ncbi:hypothetical protein MKZ38_003667 [Zalerion maritima]|uniref:Cytochrome b561 domain-containing protein n=1 Tax=Zalerion maritima TaxID=339359 RepID=A0AAD5WQ32_9PEZI|nr:hypothetical protein MKZ38_003667 [Zalerion maritima]